MLPDNQRAKMSVITPKPWNYEGLVYPEHLQFQKLKAKEMNRTVHQLINTARAGTTFPIKILSQDKIEKIYENQEIVSAKVGVVQGLHSALALETGFNYTDYPIRAELLLLTPQPIYEVIFNDTPLASLLQKAAEQGLSAVQELLYKYYEDATALYTHTEGSSLDKEYLYDTMNCLLRSYNRLATTKINAYLKAAVGLSWSIDSFVEDYQDLVKLLSTEGITQAEEYLNALLLGGELGKVGETDYPRLQIGYSAAIRVDNSAEGMGFLAITSELPVQLSRVQHSSFLDMLESVYLKTGSPLVVVYLWDDEYFAYRAPLKLPCWAVQRVS